MTKSSRVGSRSVSQSPAEVRGIDTGAWARVDADALPPEQRKLFMRRRRAIKLHLQGGSDTDIRREASMSRSNVYRLIVERCLLPHSDGDLYGWRGALPYLRVVGYRRKTRPQVGEGGAGSAGAMAAMGQPETKVGDLCLELGITRQTLYRHISPKGEMRADGAKLLNRT